MPKSDKRVQVFERNGDFFVDPPSLELSGNNNSGMTTFRLVNRTDQPLQLIIPAGPFAGAVNETVNPRSLSTQQTALNTQGAVGVYPYLVLMLTSGKKAQGNSDPVIIIDN